LIFFPQFRLAGFLTYLAAAIGENLIDYYALFSVFVLAAYFLMLVMVLKLAEDWNVSSERLILVLCFSPTILLYLIFNFDIFFAAFLVLSL